MRSLVDSFVGLHRVDLFELGTVINAAMGDDPKKRLGMVLNPPKRIRLEDLPPMLRPARKKQLNGS